MLSCTHANSDWTVSHTPSSDWMELTLMFTPSLGHTDIYVAVFMLKGSLGLASAHLG